MKNGIPCYSIHSTPIQEEYSTSWSRIWIVFTNSEYLKLIGSSSLEVIQSKNHINQTE